MKFAKLFDTDDGGQVLVIKGFTEGIPIVFVRTEYGNIKVGPIIYFMAVE